MDMKLRSDIMRPNLRVPIKMSVRVVSNVNATGCSPTSDRGQWLTQPTEP